MRVMVVCPYSLSRPGGVQGQVLALAREMRSLDVDVRVLAPCDGPPPAPGVVTVGPSVEWDSNGSVAPIAPGKAAADRTIAALRSADPDVVHLHEPLVPGPALTTMLGFAGPMIGTFHASGDEFPGGTSLRPAARRVASRLGAAIAVSDAAAAYAEAYYGVTADVLFNGIETTRIAAAAPYPSADPAVLFVGRHEPRKGLETLLDAWEGLDRRATLWVVGSGPETERLRRRRLPGVEWIGWVDDAERDRRLQGATVFCAPALGGESFGIVLLEAMAASTPVVATAIDGYQNVARADREAVLVPPGDPAALRAALRQVLDDPAQRERLIDAGRRRAEQFSMRRLAEAYVDRYEEVRTAARRRRRARRDSSDRGRGVARRHPIRGRGAGPLRSRRPAGS